MFLNLTEALNIPGAIFKGTGNGFDVYKLNSWEAANSFVLNSDERNAAEYFFRDRGTFESNCGSNSRYSAFYFTLQDTNRCVSSIILNNASGAGESGIRIYSVDGNSSVAIDVNGEYESINHHGKEIYSDAYVPLYLINGLTYSFEGHRKTITDGLLYDDSDKKLYGVLAVFTSDHDITLNLSENDINEVAADAYNYGVNVEVISNNQPTSDTALPTELTVEEPHEQESHEPGPKDYLLYKVEKDHVVIKGLKKNVEDVVIPLAIDGKPVTEIDAYAFAYSDIKHLKQEEPRRESQIEKLGKDCFSHLNTIGAAMIYVKNKSLISNRDKYCSYSNVCFA